MTMPHSQAIAEEMDRLRRADLSDDQSWKDNVIFHLGFMGMALYQQAKKIEELEAQASMFKPKGGP